MEDTFSVFWKEEDVGMFTVTAFDMWYWDGTWIANQTAAAESFVALASSLHPRDVMNKWEKGIAITLKHEESGSVTHALVLTLVVKENLLCIRIISSSEAIEWLVNKDDPKPPVRRSPKVPDKPQRSRDGWLSRIAALIQKILK